MRHAWLCLLIIAPPVSAARLTEKSAELFNIGMRYRIEGRHREAARVFTEIIAFDPEVPGVFGARGMSSVQLMLTQRRSVNAQQAEEDLTQALLRDGPSPEVYAARGFARALSGRQDGRQDLINAAGFDAAMPPLAYAGMGWYALQDGNYNHAAWLYQKAYEDSLPSSPSSPMRGWVVKQMDKVREKARRKFTEGKNAVVRRRRNVIRAPGGEELIPQRVLDAEAQQEQMRFLAEGNLEERKAAAAALGARGNDDAVPLLIDTLKLEPLELKVQAIASLGRIGSAKAVPSILKHVDHESPRVRFASVRALGEIGSERARSPLEKRLELEKNTKVRVEIGRSLKEIAEAIFNLKLDMDALMEDILRDQQRKDQR